MKIAQLIFTYSGVILLLVFGIYFTVRLGFIQITNLSVFKKIFEKNDKNASLSAFFMALGGTVGVGSITGMGFALSEGGVGSIFWMWLTSFFGMGLKYAETFIAVKYRQKGLVGAMVPLEKSGHEIIAILFALFAMLASFGGGNSAQSGAMSEAFAHVGIPPVAVACVSSAILIFTLFGDKKRILSVNSFLVPVSTLLYLLGMIFILMKTGNNLPAVLKSIFKEAIGIDKAGWGISAYLFSRGVRVGAVRGVFSHEAGMGSSPMAYGDAENTSPSFQGMLGIAEIFVDTFLVGTVTALALACNDTYSVSDLFYKFFGSGGEVIFAIFMGVFAFAAVLSWCYYSRGCVLYIFGREGAFFVYRIVAVSVFFLGCIVPSEITWGASDILNCLMIYPNLFLLYIKRKEIIHNGGKREKAVGGIRAGNNKVIGKPY